MAHQTEARGWEVNSRDAEMVALTSVDLLMLDDFALEPMSKPSCRRRRSCLVTATKRRQGPRVHVANHAPDHIDASSVDEVPGDDSSSVSSVSADGRYVAFASSKKLTGPMHC